MLLDSLNDLTRTVNTITIPIDGTMTPKATVLVFFMNVDGELVTDSVGLQVNGIFANDVSRFALSILVNGWLVGVYGTWLADMTMEFVSCSNFIMQK